MILVAIAKLVNHQSRAIISTLTDITPNRRSVENVFSPNYGVNKDIQAPHRCPEHIKACPSIPCLKMPRQRDKYEDKSKKGNNGKGRVRRLFQPQHILEAG
jgi:hypothetical protein